MNSLATYFLKAQNSFEIHSGDINGYNSSRKTKRGTLLGLRSPQTLFSAKNEVPTGKNALEISRGNPCLKKRTYFRVLGLQTVNSIAIN
uniref:Uncharacterized protein n=1 Tax=Anguilla anguilla TaxID=7936 RepID=A0A0E9WRF1_ANGAN